MQLSQLTEKKVRVGKAVRGTCVGVGISLKSRAVKYLLCSSRQSSSNSHSGPVGENPDFAVGINSVEKISEDEISLSHLRAVFPKNCAKISIGKPIYSDEGIYLGKVVDMEMKDFTALRLFTDKGTAYSSLFLAACSDVIILRKEQPFPLGQRVPAPLVFSFLKKNERVVTRSVLRAAVQSGNLLKLTLALPPFQFETIGKSQIQD